MKVLKELREERERIINIDGQEKRNEREGEKEGEGGIPRGKMTKLKERKEEGRKSRHGAIFYRF